MAGSFSRFTLSYFDRLVLFALVGLAILTGLLIWRGDKIGVRVVNVTPAEAATYVPTQTTIEITFDQIMRGSEGELPLTLTPPVSGTVRWAEKSVIFSPATPLAPDTLYTVTLADDLESEQGRPIHGLSTWQFRTRPLELLYVTTDEAEHDQLFAINPGDGATRQITQEPFGLFDYSLSPDGDRIAYAALREDGGSDLWLIKTDGSERTPLLMCPDAMCSGTAWMPGTGRLIYERRTALIEGSAPGPPRLWWLDGATGETVVVFDDTQILGYGASWSPAGAWLSYVAPSSQGVQVYNVEDGRNFVIPSRMGGLAIWNPQGDALLVPDIQQNAEGFAVHLLRAKPAEGELLDISGDGNPVEDSSPAWSPDGNWIAFTRKVAGASMGKQIWLMRPDGSEARYLTNEVDIHHGLPLWSPDNRYLAFQRFPLKELNATPAIWLLDLETETSRELVAPANRPTWLP